MSEQEIINNLYDHYKNTPKKLKIICDWDEVIQAHEPYASFQTIKDEEYIEKGFKDFFEWFWKEKDIVSYSPYGSTLNPTMFSKNPTERQQQNKNSPNFYQQAPFLTIAEDLLKLIREDKIEKLIFLSAYDKRKFSDGDPRKKEIVKETFGKFLKDTEIPLSLELIPFDNEIQGQTKADWIKQNAPDFDIFIDDNPLICKDIIENTSNPNSKNNKEARIQELLKRDDYCWVCTKPVIREELGGFQTYADKNHFFNYLSLERPIHAICWDSEENKKDRTISYLTKNLISLPEYLALKEGKFKDKCRWCKKELHIKDISGYTVYDDGLTVTGVVCQDKKCQDIVENFRTVTYVRELGCSFESEYWNAELNKVRPIDHSECECHNCEKPIGNREFYWDGERSHYHLENDLECEKAIAGKVCKNCKKPIKAGEIHYWSVECPIKVSDDIIKVDGSSINLTNDTSMIVCSPYYPATAEQHHPEVLLIKNEVSGLKKEDFSK